MSEDNRRIIKINTESFKIPHTTRKNRRPPGEAKIKVKSPVKEHNNATLKRKLMKFIRNQHDQKIKDNEKPADSGEFKTEFKESLDYLSKMAKNTDTGTGTGTGTNAHNRTLKSYLPILPIPVPLPFISTAPPFIQPAFIPPPIIQPQPAFTPPPFIQPAFMPPPIIQSAFMPHATAFMPPPTIQPQPPFVQLPFIQPTQPDYGCLKGGSLPLYKNWKNQTQKNNMVPPPIRISDLSNPAAINHIKQKMSEIKTPKPRPRKQKRTVRRTYRIGRSKVFPKVSVLVSNRTIRNNITTKTQLLKQTPIGEVKKFLIKNGFIKIGSIAPNDVLRKMYESATLMCGEVMNHNPEYLLYNFMNALDH